MIWCRFYLDKEKVDEDYRPLVWPIKYPYWCTGEVGEYFTLVAYIDSFKDLYKQWPEAENIDSEIVNEITFTDRFPRPSWYNVY